MADGRVLTTLYELEATGQRRPDASQLRALLAKIMSTGVEDSERHKLESEALLQEAVTLRTQKRRLEEDLALAQDSLVRRRTESRQRQDAWVIPCRALQLELDAQLAELRDANLLLKRLDARWVLAEDPDRLVDQVRFELQRVQEDSDELTTARNAAEGMRGPMRERVAELDAEVAKLRTSLKDVKEPPMDRRDIMILRQNVTVLAARVAALNADCDDEVRQLRPRIVEELPRLREAEKDRSHLHRELIKATLDKDRMEMDYEAVVVGLAEQEAVQFSAHQSMRESLTATEAEEASLLRSIRDSDRECAEMRRDGIETEIFVHHLSDEIARLEDQRDELRASLGRSHVAAALVSGGTRSQAGALFGPMDQAEWSAWLHQDRSMVLSEWQAAELRDEEEVRLMTLECQELHDTLKQAEINNSEIRQHLTGPGGGARELGLTLGARMLLGAQGGDPSLTPGIPMAAATVIGPDWNRDGIPDIMQSSGQYGLTDYGPPLPIAQVGGVVGVDLNRDGIPDILQGRG